MSQRNHIRSQNSGFPLSLSVTGRVAARLGIFLTIGLATFVRADSAVAKEYKVKAAFIYNFAKFVEWPAQKLADDGTPIIIGVLGPNPFGDELEIALKGRQINGRSVVVRQFDTVETAKTAHLLFVSLNDEGKIRKALREYGVLTVGQSESFSRNGGIITFSFADDKLRFEINIAAATQAGLKISAQLQKLALNVRKEP